MTSRKVLTTVTVAIIVAWCLLVLSSWLLSAMMVDGVRSLLTGEGLRWLFGNMTEALLSPLLVWLLMAAMTWGCLKGSYISHRETYRRKTALRVAALFTLSYVTVIVLLTALPHAVLLSPTGTLHHSPFSRSLVPLMCLGMLLFGVVYGLVTRSFTSFHDIIEAMLDGLRSAAPLFFGYMLLMPLAQTIRYVFF